MAKDNKNRSKVVVIEQRLLKSKAYRALRTPTAYFVLGIFWTRRQISKVRHNDRHEKVILNNGEITFSYKDAKEKYGISAGAFRSAVDELREKGFVDIAESGAGLYKSANLYSMSERWKLYGTAEYKEPKPRPKGPINKGFKRGNKHGRNCRTK